MMKESILELAGWSAAAFLLSFAGVLGLTRWARRHGVLDVPNERSAHAHPVPRGGGLPIVLVTFSFLWLYCALHPEDIRWRAILTFSAGGILIAFVSWLDDIRSLPNSIRISVHSVAALLAIWGTGYWFTSHIPELEQAQYGWIGLPMTFLWIIGLTNAYNFMDGVDGLAGTMAVAGGAGWFIADRVDGLHFVAALGLLVAASSLGFLCLNWPPARVFMGDVGSAFLGYTFSVVPLWYGTFRKDGSAGTVALLALILMWPFVFDSAFTILRRLVKGENIFKSHQSHLYQRLWRAGYSHRFITVLYGALAASGLLLSVPVACGLTWGAPVAIAVVVLLAAALWGTVGVLERRRARLASPPPGRILSAPQKPLKD